MSDKAPMRMVVIGAGGIGSSLVNYLAMMLEYGAPWSALLIVDGDVFEPKNKSRQLFKMMGNKAESLAAELSEQMQKTVVVPIGKWIVEEIPEDELNGDPGETDEKITAEKLLQEGDIIFPVVDNFKARKVVFDAASKLNNVDVISAGNDDALFCSLYHYRRRDGMDVTMHPRLIHPEYENPPDRNPGEMSCQERAAIDGGTQFVAANVAATALILGKVQSVIFGEEERVDPDDEVWNSDEIFMELGEGKAAPFDRSAEQETVATPAADQNLTTIGVS